MKNYYENGTFVSLYDNLLNDIRFKGQLVGKTRELMNTQICLTDPRYGILPYDKNWRWAFQELLDRMSYTYGYKQLSNPGRAFIYRPRWEKKLQKEGGKFHYSYGEMFNNQLEEVYKELKSNKSSREAVITLWTPKYLINKKQYLRRPCTLNFHFIIRDKKLHCFVSMRSNDVINLLPYDVFHHSFIQRWLAYRLDLDLGHYYHSSTHSYYPKKREAEGRNYFDKFFGELGDSMSKLDYLNHVPLSLGQSLDYDFKKIYKNYNDLENIKDDIDSPFLNALINYILDPKENTYLL